MHEQSLEDVVRDAESPVDLLRTLEGGAFGFPVVSDEYTHWIEEQRAWKESCAFADQSHHMVDMWVTGPDVFEAFTDYAVNDFDNFTVGQAKQLVVCNPDGYFIGDGILLRLDEDELAFVGPPQAPNWLQFNIEAGDYDVTVERDETSGVRDGPPTNFRYQVQGPEAIKIMEEVTDEPLPEIGFFNFESASIGGHDVDLLRHGMAGEPGFEFWGDWKDSDEVRETVLEAGEEYGIRRLGSKSYGSSSVISGWVGMPLAAIYDGGAMREYREWLSARSLEANYSIAGSFESDDITDYYLTPVELGYGRLIDFDRNFVGREALEEEVEDPSRRLVTLEWNAEDVIDVFGSLFTEGSTEKFLDFPVPWRSAAHYDAVLNGTDTVGVSMWAAYTYNERAMLSLAVVDTDLSEPGTELTLVWGEPDDASSTHIERHERTEISVTVAPVPYTDDRR